MSILKSKILPIIAIGSAAFMPSIAQAHSYTFSGIVGVSKLYNFECTVTVVKTPDHDEVTGDHLDTGSVTITISAPVDAACGALSVTNPMRYEQGPAGIGGWKPMRVFDFFATTISLGNCYAPYVDVIKREVSPGVWEMDISATIPGDLGTPDCVIDGVVSTI